MHARETWHQAPQAPAVAACPRQRTSLRRSAKKLLAAVLATLASLGLLGWLTGALDGPRNALNHPRLPYYTDASLQPRWDRWSSWRHVAAWSLTDHHDRAIDQHLLERRPTVVGFLYAGCSSACPVSLELLRMLDDRLAQSAGLARPQFLLLTTRPEFDTPAALASYAQRLRLPADWVLATGTPGAVRELARSLMSDISSPAPGAGPAHAQRAYLLDESRRIRGVYDAGSMVEMRRLAGDWERLRLEP